MSTATIYAHRFDAPNDESAGLIGGSEPDAPAYWARSVEIAKAWEAALAEVDTPHTRKLALRTAMVMSPDRGGIFDVLLGLVRAGLGGSVAGGAQYVSWIHERDLVRAVLHLIEHEELEGPVNLAAPGPLPQRDFMAALRSAYGRGVGLPATAWMAEIGAFFLRTDTELLLKSRRVVPGRLLDSGFRFEHTKWPEAARDLVASWRAARAVEVEPHETSRSAAIKGAVVAFVAHLAFCMALLAFAARVSLALAHGPPANHSAVATLAAIALAPTLLIGAGLGWLARQLRRVRTLSLMVVALPAPIVVFAATFGALGLSPSGLVVGAALGLIFSTFHVPISLVASAVLARWVRPASAEPDAGSPADRGPLSLDGVDALGAVNSITATEHRCSRPRHIRA